MPPLSFKRHRFPREVILQAVWLYFRFTLSLRDVEELAAERRIEVSYETIRCWTIKSGRFIARRLKTLRPAPTGRWPLGGVVCSIGSERMYLWRAVDDDGEVLDLVVQKARDTGAALKLLKRLLRNQPTAPERITTDGLRSYGAALRELGLERLHQAGRLRENNRAENSHLAIRRRAGDAGLQEPSSGPAVPDHPCGDLQRLLHAASPHQAAHAEGVPGRSLSDLVTGDVCPSSERVGERLTSVIKLTVLPAGVSGACRRAHDQVTVRVATKPST
jgi:putative transposase